MTDDDAARRAKASSVLRELADLIDQDLLTEFLVEVRQNFDEVVHDFAIRYVPRGTQTVTITATGPEVIAAGFGTPDMRHQRALTRDI